MKKLILMLVICVSAAAQAKTLTASCNSAKNSVELVADIANVNTEPVINSLKVDGNKIGQLNDISKMPVYKNGDINMKVQFGRGLYSSVSFDLQKCNDDFEATGTAVLEEYVGGFMGTSLANLKCTCSLK